ncbi:MAG: prepilin-type N-terminal cleavage/methylation domain-containing protein [Candidatus Omnitrophica bacterium]|nr:prepilin-type N-terminal cleavage/methylation domain-containing protein [Candidatus Omnitrophota bacterium]
MEYGTSCPTERGFTFIEILLTLLIISIAAMPLMRLFATAIEQADMVDELRTALDLGREEVEKIKNLSLSEEQLKAIGNVVSPPIVLNKTLWFTVRIVDPDEKPMKVTVYVLRDSLASKPVVSFVTIVSK